MLLLVTIAVISIIAVILNRKADTSTMLDVGTLDLNESRSSVLVELFTSEGCSSCPPADQLLDRLESAPGAEIIALSEHVDYWNRLGWADPFSSSEFSARQSRYARAFNLDSIYTPQMVVDGQREFVGSNAAAARSAIEAAARAPKASIRILPGPVEGDSLPLDIRIENLPRVSSGDTAEVLLAITESGLQSNVTRGENSGRRLSHTAVARKLEPLGEAASRISAQVRLEKGWKRDNLRAVVFIQERDSRRVIGAASVRLGS